MSNVIVDAGTRDKRLAGGSTALVQDESGRILGRFIRDETSSDDSGHGLSAGVLARRLAPDTQTYSTDEVLVHLRSLS
jgi:hypothetical protein